MLKCNSDRRRKEPSLLLGNSNPVLGIFSNSGRKGRKLKALQYPKSIRCEVYTGLSFKIPNRNPAPLIRLLELSALSLVRFLSPAVTLSRHDWSNCRALSYSTRPLPPWRHCFVAFDLVTFATRSDRCRLQRCMVRRTSCISPAMRLATAFGSSESFRREVHPPP